LLMAFRLLLDSLAFPNTQDRQGCKIGRL